VKGGYADTGNTASDPLFLSAPGNLRLRPGSPCFDTGTGTGAGAPAADILGCVRPQGAGVDMGAYEGNAFGLYPPFVSGPAAPVAAPSWTWTPGGGAAGIGLYRYGLAEGVWDAVDAASTSYAPAQFKHGLNTLYVQERDAAGNWSASGLFTVMVGPAPPITIVKPPVGGSVRMGNGFMFSVSATGGYGTLLYQWKKDEVNIPYANDASFAVTSTELEDTGLYSVEITDASGDTIESVPVMLTVTPPVPVAGMGGLALLAAALGLAALRRRN